MKSIKLTIPVLILLMLYTSCQVHTDSTTSEPIGIPETGADKPFHDPKTREVFKLDKVWWDGYTDMSTEQFMAVLNKEFAGDNGTIDNVTEVVMLWGAHYRYTQLVKEYPDIKLLQDALAFLDEKRVWVWENTQLIGEL